LSGDVVKQMQLAKQLEQKAKEASRKKETAETLAKEAQEALGKALAEGLPMDAEQALLKDVEKAISNKDYNAAIATAVQVTQGCEKARRARIEENVSALEEALELVKDEGRRKALQSGLDKANELCAEGELDAASAALQEVALGVEDAASAHAKAMADKIRSLLILSARLGLDLREQEKAFNGFRGAIDQGKSREVISLARSTLDDVETALRGEFARRSEAMRPMANQNATVAGGLRVAERRIDAGDIEGAFAELLAMDGEVRRGTIDEKRRELERLERRAAIAAKFGGDTGMVDSKLREAARRLREDDLDGALRSIDELQVGMKDLETSIFTEKMMALRPRLAVANKVRIDITAGERKVDLARAAMTEGDFTRAMTELQQAEDIIVRSIQGHEQLEACLAHTLVLFRVASDLKADVAKAKQLITQARQVALIRDFKRATSILNAADGELSRRIEETVGREILTMEMDIMLAQKMGVDTEDEGAMLETATQMVQKGDYEECVRTLREAAPSLRGKVKDSCANFLAEFTLSVEEHRGPGDKGPARRTLEEARARFESGQYSACYDMGLQALMQLRAQEREILRARSAEVAAMMRMLDELDIDEPALVEQAERLRRLETGGDPADAMDLANRVYNESSLLVAEEVERRLMATERQLSALKRKGLASATDLEAVDTAAALLANGKMRESLASLQEAERRSERVAREQTDIYDVIVEMSILLDEAVARDMHVEQQLAMLEKARGLYESGRLGEARLAASAAMREARVAVCEFVAPEALRNSWDLLLLARKIEMPVEALEQRYYEAEDALNQHRYNTSLDKSEIIREEVTGRLRSALSERLRPVEAYLSQGRASRYGEEALFPLLGRARVLIMERRYSEAAELASHLGREVEALREKEREAERAVQTLREMIAKLDDIGLDATEARAALDVAARQAEHSDPVPAAYLAKLGTDAALSSASGELQTRAERMLEEYQLKSLEGEDLQTAALRLEEMLALSQRGMLEEASQKLRGVEASLREYQRLRRLAEKDMVEVEHMATTAALKGIQIEGLSSAIAEARVQIEHGEPSAAHALLSAKKGELAWSMQIIGARKESMTRLRAAAEEMTDASRRQDALDILSRAETRLNEMELIDDGLGMRRASALIKEAKDQETARQRLQAAIAAEMLLDADMAVPDAKGDAAFESRRSALTPLLQKARASAEAAVAQSPSGPGMALSKKAGDHLAAGQVIEAIEAYRAAAMVAPWSSIEAADYLEMRRHSLELLNMSSLGSQRKERRLLTEIESGRPSFAEASESMKRLNKDLERSLASMGAVLDIDIDTDEPLMKGRRHKVCVRLNNNGPVPVQGMELKAECDADAEMPEMPPRLEAYSSVRLDIVMQARGPGELPMRLQMTYMIPTTRRRHRLERSATFIVSG
jgi:hypothetical protein